MTAQQIVSLLQLIADLYSQIASLQTENKALTQQLETLAPKEETSGESLPEPS